MTIQGYWAFVNWDDDPATLFYTCLHRSNLVIKRVTSKRVTSGATKKMSRGQSSRTCVGKYELGRTLGEGTFAKVKFARNTQNGEAVAIKIIDRDKVLRHKMADQIKTEIKSMKLIKHPNVVQLHEVLASRTKIYMVIDFVDGGELFDKIVKQRHLTEDEARKYFQQLIDAIDYCHSRGVYHRDLKPENLLLDSHGVLKVSDFGLSALAYVREDGLLRTACGTPNYVAPEVLSDKGYDGRASDIWSCGVILFVLLAGYLPFEAAYLPDLYKKIHSAKFKSPHWFSSDVKMLIHQILDPNPKTRINIEQIKDDNWFRKNYQPPNFGKDKDVNLDDIDAIFENPEENLVTERRGRPEPMNAFSLISRSEGLNLDNLFEKQMKGLIKRETRFTSKCPPDEIMTKIEEAAAPLGFNAQKRNYKMKLKGDKSGRKGHLSVATELFEVAPSVHIVELRKTSGDTLEFHTFYNSFKEGLKDVVWKAEAITEEKDEAQASTPITEKKDRHQTSH
ncbi:CBL-interacting protein kinase 9 [Rhynchospora pubera]|uniref:non-specific serine/threonine protein kinase n=2 Tax=Rhynchospora pubera TaxID=906938 RepID=A0AAV8BTP1_9POAL|nr:CBL-interacting protein kinase 9 [Rhynchospora pubera]